MKAQSRCDIAFRGILVLVGAIVLFDTVMHQNLTPMEF